MTKLQWRHGTVITLAQSCGLYAPICACLSFRGGLVKQPLQLGMNDQVHLAEKCNYLLSCVSLEFGYIAIDGIVLYVLPRYAKSCWANRGCNILGLTLRVNCSDVMTDSWRLWQANGVACISLKKGISPGFRSVIEQGISQRILLYEKLFEIILGWKYFDENKYNIVAIAMLTDDRSPWNSSLVLRVDRCLMWPRKIL